MIEHPAMGCDTRIEIGPLPADFVVTDQLFAAVLEAAEACDYLGTNQGLIYLLHFERPYQHAKHYTGWTPDLPRRLDAHVAGRGARLMAVITQAGIGWQLARLWIGTRTLERALKNQGGASRRCPLCGVTPRPDRMGDMQ